MSKTEVSGKQIKDGSIELVDLSNAVATDISTLKSDVATLQTDVAAKADVGTLATVATSGSYDDLTNKPNIPSLSGYATEAYVDGAVSGLVNSAPATLDTLKELSDALGADANFAATVAGQIGDIASDVSALDVRVTTAEGDISSLQSDVSSLQNSVSAGTNIGDLNGVAITSPSAGQVLTYNGLGWVNGAAPSSFSGSYNDLTDKPTLFSGSYVDLSNKPTLFDGAYSSLTGAPSLATVATSGSYADLSNKPTLASFATITSPASGHHLRYNGTAWVNAAIPASDLPVANSSAGILDTGFQIILGEKRFGSTIQASGITSSGTSLSLSGGLAGTFPGGKIVFTGGSTTGSMDFYTKVNGQQFVEQRRANISDTGLFSMYYGASIESGAAATKGLIVKGAASQTANLFEVQNSSSTVLASISSAGTVHATRYTEAVANAFNTSLAPSSGTLTVDTSVGNAVLGALSASVTTWAFTNVPTDNSKVTTVTAVLAGNASYTYGDACSVNGSAVSGGIMWSGGSAPTSTSNTDIITFVIVRDSAGTIKVFGSATTNFS
jgi:hypothetical protein